MTWFFIVVVLLFFMNSPLLIESQKCSLDIDCLEMGEGFCIYDECYAREEYGQPCTWNRQCHRDNQRCWNQKCDCLINYKRLRTRCVPKDFCEFSSDCEEGDYCARKTATTYGLCYLGRRSGLSPGIIALIVIFVVSILILGCFVLCRLRCPGQSITEFLIRDQQPTRVIQEVTVQRPVIQPLFSPVSQPISVYQSVN